MISSIKLKNFKAFNDTPDNGMLNITLDGKNLLIYGDNGSGKSSIYEALKLSFYKRRLLANIIVPDEEKESVIETVLAREYDNKYANGFEVDVNGTKTYADSTINDFDFEVSLLNLYSTIVTAEKRAESKRDTYKFLNLKTLLEREFLSIHVTYEEQDFSELITNVNAQLQAFKEDIQIALDIDLNIKIDEEEHLNLYFNEAKINLVILLLLFESIYLYSDRSTKSVIVLDDIITSLDMANRTFLLKYILERFTPNSFQLIILTHNLEVYKLVEFIKNDIVKNNNKFISGQLFEINNIIKFLDKNFINLSDIEKEIENDPTKAGNMMRRKFEFLIHTLARELIIGSNDEADKIVKFLGKSKKVYLKKVGDNNYTANDLVSKIEEKITNETSVAEIRTLINSYKISPAKIEEISKIINGIKLYRKVIMNPLSHNEAPFATKELYESLDLLRRLDEMEFEEE